MTPPPGIAGTAEPLSGVTTGLAGDTEPAPTAKQWAIRFLMAECGVTGAQARRLFEAHQLDQERPAATADVTYRASFIDWLMRQAPAGRKPTVRKWRVGDKGSSQWRIR